LTPEYRPFLEATSGRLRVLRTLVTDAVGNPGTITSVKPLTIAATEGGLVLELVQPEGKRAMSGSDFANGARLRPGNCLIDLAT
jgi:methionyl-tRNA formyltransferase